MSAAPASTEAQSAPASAPFATPIFDQLLREFRAAGLLSAPIAPSLPRAHPRNYPTAPSALSTHFVRTPEVLEKILGALHQNVTTKILPAIKG
jgi:hypothetical protein